MSHTFAACLLVMQAAMGFAAAETHTVTLEGASAEQKWTLKELSPDLPADWSAYDYVVLELRASSPQRFQLGVATLERRSKSQEIGDADLVRCGIASSDQSRLRGRWL